MTLFVNEVERRILHYITFNQHGIYSYAIAWESQIKKYIFNFVKLVISKCSKENILH